MIGLWLGMLICTLVPCICSITYIIRMNWNQVAAEAQHRAKLSQKPVEDLNSAPIPEKIVSCSGRTDAQNGVVLLSFTTVDGPTLQDKKMASLPAAGQVLTTKQLIVRRGLAAGAAVGILAVGVLIRIFTV
ncbi:multidrug and toxin extrusion protein 2 isoform X2 [Python bivittatus]|uniref:Multidrug and toxin extrusion protein 2 isoform X2 n=1 Tax=Python bivittatus TaxID=176946 RepID=A0A9F5MPU5_PYTBI|nr:multidrug and toxin extrusion protein 2 isoform X2 [Python bivittatus]